MNQNICGVDGCCSATRGKSSLYCQKHYMRVYRNGTTEKKIQPRSFLHSGGYVLVPANGHWLARGSSHAYEHRLVYEAANGAGPFGCFWCGVEVTWDDLHIDHKDDCKTNNHISNLAASCAKCNQQRGRQKSQKTWAKKFGFLALGRLQTLSEWSRETGLSRSALKARIASGMTPDEVVTKPRGIFGPPSSRPLLVSAE